MKNMQKIMMYLNTFILSMICLIGNSQIPIVKAVGGEGKIVNWELEKKKADPQGPGYFYHDCYQGVQPVKASSTLANQGTKNYSIKNLNDEDPFTAWVEGKADYGIGEWFEIKASGVNVIYNGYQSSPKNWLENSRVKRFKVYKNNVPICILELTDEMGRQVFELPGHDKFNSEKESIFRFEILEVYEGTKWKDVAISEIDWALCCVAENTTISSLPIPVNIAEISQGQFVLSVDIVTGLTFGDEVTHTSKQIHLSLLKIKTETKELALTFNHPLFIKSVGFCSIRKYMDDNNINNYEELVDKIEFWVFDENTKKLTFEKLKEISVISGVFNTYTISGLKRGNTYISNGFVTRDY